MLAIFAGSIQTVGVLGCRPLHYFSIGPAEIGVLRMAAYPTALYALFHLLSLVQGIGDDDRALFVHLRARLGFRRDASD
jgi:hypothetical protein